MNKIDSSNYEFIANRFTASSIAQPIKMVFPPDIPLVSVWEQFMEYNPMEDWCCLIRDDHHTYGYLTFDSECFEHPLEGVVGKGERIDPEIIVTYSLPLLELVPLFETSFFFFLLTSNKITHVVSFLDLDRLPFKFCVFSLFMEIESLMTELLTIDNSKIEGYLRLLPKNRFSKAEKLCSKKYPKAITPEKILLCTNFSDRTKMFMTSPDLWDERLFGSKEKAGELFDAIRLVRNLIAHSDSLLEILGVPSELNKFIRELSNLIDKIKDMKK